MVGSNIQVIPGNDQDWIVKEEGSGRELGHYPTQEAAEDVGQALARRRRSKLLVFDQAGKLARRKAPSAGGWFRRLFGG